MPDYETKKIFAENLTQLLRAHKVTQADLAAKMDVAPSTVSSWCTGDKMPRMDKIEWIAEHFSVNRSDLLEEKSSPEVAFDNIFPIQLKKYRLLGEIACGEPIFCDEERESYIMSGTEIKADFCLKCKGDSMINARIYDGDIVFIRQQDEVENGEIAAVVIDNEATLKRVYYYPEQNMVILKPENPKYADIILQDESLNTVRILGKAIAFQSDVR